ncbi:hypothetical protein I317_06583 [Kwoniella heveanensis CBS 569]|nr:hypothetical protein I317_06583 [Kwoniella heveanensis CBS 569]
MIQLASLFNLATGLGLVGSINSAGASPLKPRDETSDLKMSFIQDIWPAAFKGGESFEVSWQGGSGGPVTLDWIADYGDGQRLVNTVFKNETKTQHTVYFSPKRCYASDVTFQFIVYDSDGVPLPENRGYGLKVPLVPGNEDGDCKQNDV